jgi:hypothetical protein
VALLHRRVTLQKLGHLDTHHPRDKKMNIHDCKCDWSLLVEAGPLAVIQVETRDSNRRAIESASSSGTVDTALIGCLCGPHLHGVVAVDAHPCPHGPQPP